MQLITTELQLSAVESGLR